MLASFARSCGGAARASAFSVLVLAVGCTMPSEDGDGDDDDDDETVESASDALTGNVAAGATLKTTAALNLRSSPSTAASILRVIPQGGLVTAVSGTPSGPWYNVRYDGTAGWAHGGYLVASAPPPPANDFKLPLGCGTSAQISQGNHGSFSHTGVAAYAFDFRLDHGTPLRAMRRGRVSFARGDVLPGNRCYYGGDRSCANTLNYVVVDHFDGTSTAYLHLSSTAVRVGQTVEQGTIVGRSGASGWSTGPHAHVQRQTNCGSWYCQSVTMRFSDVANGVPSTGQVVTSRNGC
jgi:murein DD-endopeptidase MepM/ murein hydrolase activator NlpD